jgi:hypothetical protein
MDFKVERVEYERGKRLAYVEFRSLDADGGQAIVFVTFKFQPTIRLSKRRMEEDIIREARKIFARAYKAT